MQYTPTLTFTCLFISLDICTRHRPSRLGYNFSICLCRLGEYFLYVGFFKNVKQTDCDNSCIALHARHARQ